jgi:hypothetical protein
MNTNSAANTAAGTERKEYGNYHPIIQDRRSIGSTFSSEGPQGLSTRNLCAGRYKRVGVYFWKEGNDGRIAD